MTARKVSQDAPQANVQRLVVSLPLPPTACWPNRQRVHWRERWAAQKEAKQWGEYAGTDALHAAFGVPYQAPCWDRCAVTVRFRWPDARRRDLDNALGACKPYLDAFTDLCIWSDDSGVSFTIPAAVIDREQPGVTITITPIAEGE